MAQTRRVISDCRKMPEANCSLTIAGNEEEVMEVAVPHGVKKHGFKDTPSVRDQIRASLVEDKEPIETRGGEEYQGGSMGAY